MGRAVAIGMVIFLLAVLILLVGPGANATFTILVIALALLSIVGTMYFVLREQRAHDAHTRYVRSPWNEEPAPPAETPSESVTVPPSGNAHTPLTDHVTPADEEPTNQP
jgi:disulfide bond formation protein DsbB